MLEQAIARCFVGRRNGNAFVAPVTPTPGTANVCP
jgi:hypothetical protein